MADGTTEIQLNIAARKNAEEAIEALGGYTVGVNEERFWECLAIQAAARVGKVLTDEGPFRYPMTDEEARHWERTAIPRGQYRGRRVGEVPPDYWGALADDVFSKNLRRYVQSDHYRRKVGLMSETLQTRQPNTARVTRRDTTSACSKPQKK